MRLGEVPVRNACLPGKGVRGRSGIPSPHVAAANPACRGAAAQRGLQTHRDALERGRSAGVSRGGWVGGGSGGWEGAASVAVSREQRDSPSAFSLQTLPEAVLHHSGRHSREPASKAAERAPEPGERPGGSSPAAAALCPAAPRSPTPLRTGGRGRFGPWVLSGLACLSWVCCSLRLRLLGLPSRGGTGPAGGLPLPVCASHQLTSSHASSWSGERPRPGGH